MKLLIITAITMFENDIKELLKKAGVKTFSYREVTGYSDISEQTMNDNWFASEINETESILFYAFVEQEKVKPVLSLVSAFNASQETASKVHVAVLNIEGSNP